MPVTHLERALNGELDQLELKGSLKGGEDVIEQVLPAGGDRGPRSLLAGHDDRQFLKMNSNSYLGISLRPEILEAEAQASHAFGSGPGAVRFISGTYRAHIELEQSLARFHGREAGMIFSSAYATTLGVLVPLISAETTVISDELNHNCIINAMRLARPKAKSIYRHNDLTHLESRLTEAAGASSRAIVVTDGVFSMRGDLAPLADIAALVRGADDHFDEGAILVVDDSHGVGALGETGRGTEEVTGARADVLVATLGKALGVNGGYVVTTATIVRYLRETAPLYIYSNPITVGEAAAALASIEILDSAEGRRLLEHLRTLTARFEKGLVDLGYETIPGEHPVVPLMVRDTERTSALVAHLKENGVLATGLNYPVVPRGDEEIRFQVNADHTEADIDLVLGVLGEFPR